MLRNCSSATSIPTRRRTGGASALETATTRAGIRRSNTRAICLLRPLRAATTLGRHPRHAPARDRRAQPLTRRRVADSRTAHRLHGDALYHRHAQRETLDGDCPQYRDQRPRGKAADCANTRALLPRLVAPSDDRPEGHRHRQTTVRGRAPGPAGGRLSRPTRPPLLATRPEGASNNRPRTHRRPQPSSHSHRTPSSIQVPVLMPATVPTATVTDRHGECAPLRLSPDLHPLYDSLVDRVGRNRPRARLRRFASRRSRGPPSSEDFCRCRSAPGAAVKTANLRQPTPSSSHPANPPTTDGRSEHGYPVREAAA